MNLMPPVDMTNAVPAESAVVRDSSNSHRYIRELSHSPPPNGRASRSPRPHKSSKFTPNQKLPPNHSSQNRHSKKSHDKRVSSRSPSHDSGDGPPKERSRSHRSGTRTSDRKTRKSPSSRSHSPRRSGPKHTRRSQDRSHHRSSSKPKSRSPERSHHRRHRGTRSPDEKRSRSSHKRAESGVAHRSSDGRSKGPHASKSSHARLVDSSEAINRTNSWGLLDTSITGLDDSSEANSWGLLDTSTHQPSPGGCPEKWSSSKSSDGNRNSRFRSKFPSIAPSITAIGSTESDEESDANTECAIQPSVVDGARLLRKPARPSRNRRHRKGRHHHRHYVSSSVTVASMAVLSDSDEESGSDANSVTERASNARRSVGHSATRVSSATAKRTLYGDDGDAKAKEKASSKSSKHAVVPGVEAVGSAPVRKSSSSGKVVGALYGSDADAKAKAKAGASNYGPQPGAKVVPLPATSAHKIHIAQGVKDGVLDEEEPVARRVLLAGTDDSEPDFNLEGQPLEGTSVDKDKKQHNQDKPKKKRRRWIGLFLLLLLLIGAAIAVWFFLFRNDGSQRSQIDSKAEGVTTPAPQNNTAALSPATSPSSPTIAPTAPPVLEDLLFEPPSKQNCDAIARNLTIAGRYELENADFGLNLEVVLSDENLMTRPLVDELLNAIQEKVLPSIAGCNVGADEYVEAWRFVIFDAFVTGNAKPEEKCNNKDLITLNCHRVNVQLDVFLKGHVRFLDIIRLISDEEVNIANNLDLSDTFSIIQLVSIESLTPTSAPTTTPTDEPSVPPTDAPTVKVKTTPVPTSRPSIETTSVATGEPSKRPTPPPTLAPSVALGTPLPNSDPISLPTQTPTGLPSQSPTLAPTAPGQTPVPTTPEPTTPPPTTSPPTPLVLVPSTESPSERPSMAPVVGPTLSPTNIPTERPTTSAPTKAPTPPPSESPTVTPTKSPTKSPTVSPTTRPPTPSPTASPSTLPTPEPIIGYAQLVKNQNCAPPSTNHVTTIEGVADDDACANECFYTPGCVVFVVGKTRSRTDCYMCDGSDDLQFDPGTTAYSFTR